MKSLLLIQPGAFGDIIMCAPIAKWYSRKGYQVFWPSRRKFSELIKQFPYVTSIILDEETHHEDWLRSDVIQIYQKLYIEGFDEIVNLADRGPHPTAQQHHENFEKCKYRLAGVPFNQKHNLTWDRDKGKEDSLYEMIVEEEGEYSLVSLNTSNNENLLVPTTSKRKIFTKEVPGYSILDWYKIIQEASDIYCVESAFHHFIDGIILDLQKPCYLLRRDAVEYGCRFTHSLHWDHSIIGPTEVKG